jgi:hypothetical protein
MIFLESNLWVYRTVSGVAQFQKITLITTHRLLLE